MGPKPFSSTTGDVSFDKVFAVPLAPGSHENISNVGQDSGVEMTPAQGAKPDLIVEIEIKSKETGFSKERPLINSLFYDLHLQRNTKGNLLCPEMESRSH